MASHRGEKGALKTATALADAGAGAFLIDLSWIAGRKMDLDD